MIDILIMCFIFFFGNLVGFLYVYERIYIFIWNVFLNIVLGIYMYINVFIYVYISTFIISNVDIGMYV